MSSALISAESRAGRQAFSAGNWRECGGLEAAEALLSADPRPTAILVSDSLQTVALHRGLAEAGLRAGRDISILGLLTEARTQYLTPMGFVPATP